MNYILPVDYTKEDVKKFFESIGADSTWLNNVSNSRMMYLLSLVWDSRTTVQWSDIPSELKVFEVKQKNMTARRIHIALEKAAFDMSFLINTAINELEVFNHDVLDYDGNEKIRDEAMQATGMHNYMMLGYGGWLIRNQPINLDMDNNQ
jgi:hypothetical protein